MKFSALLSLALITATLSLRAEDPISSSAEPEVRRALPIAPSNATPVPVMRAIPVSTPNDSDIFNVPRAVPQPSVTVAQPIASPTPLTVAPSSDPEGSIRFGPSLSADSEAATAAQLEIAEGFFAHKQPEEAVPEYEKFLAMSSKNTPGKERALYHLAESQRLMGSSMAAEATLQRLLQENPSGEFKAAAQFRLGELNEVDGNLLAAADSFSQAAINSKDLPIQQTALWREALVREKSGQKEQAVTVLETLAKTTGTNAFKIPAMLHLAESAVDAGDKKQALAWYSEVLNTKTSGEEFAEAAVKSALIQSDLGNQAEAKTLLDKVAASKDSGRWQSVAALGSLRIASQSGDEASVLRLAPTALIGNPDNKPEILLLQANALRKQGKYAQALELYDTILREFPGSKAASQAPFQRLLTLHATRASSLLTEIDDYLLTASEPTDRARAQLLKAEETLRRGQFKEAAALYYQVDTKMLPPSAKPDILYKEAWALTQSGDKDAAITPLGQFLEAYPNDERSPTALAQRGLLKQQKNDFAGALADFSQLESQYPKAKERELALQQKALLLGQQQDPKGMVEAFTLLLHDYPKSTAAAQAHYWIGATAIDNKDYAAAVTELTQARTGDPKQFGERAGIRILLAQYSQNHPDEAALEAMALPPSMIPPEVGKWLGTKALESGNPAKAERFLAPLVKEGLPGASDSELQADLASALVAQGKYREAQAPSTSCLKLSRDPASRAKALLVAASIQRSMNNLAGATSMIDEALLLQPEGPINAEARILSGDMLFARHDYAGAAKAYVTVAVLSDDPVQTPRALTKAIDAYRRSGNKVEADKIISELQKRFPQTPVPATPKL